MAATGLLVLAGACRRPEPVLPPIKLELLQPQQIAQLGTAVRCGAFHAGELVAGGTEAGSVIVSRQGKPAILGEPRQHSGPVAGLAFSSDGKHLLSAGGELAIWWDTERGVAAGMVKGPQRITAAVLHDPGDGSTPMAFWGTALGAMVRWPVQAKAAEPLRQLACPAFPVQAARRQLPEAERCPFGTFVEAVDGSGAACVYPVTAMALSGSTLWRACREGSLYGWELVGKTHRGFGVGFVQAIAGRADGRLFLARAEGELRLLDSKRGELVGDLQPAGAAQVAASAGEYLAVAQGQQVLVFVGASRQPSAQFGAGSQVVGLSIDASQPAIRTLTAEGRAEVRTIRRP